MPAWLSQGLCFSQKEAFQILRTVTDTEKVAAHNTFARMVRFEETLKLADLYGQALDTTTLKAQVTKRLDLWADAIHKEADRLKGDLSPAVKDSFHHHKARLLARCETVAPEFEITTHQLDEEQERELEQEQEQEKHVERPAKLSPHKPTLNSRLRSLVVNSEEQQPQQYFIEFAMPIGDIFDRTTLKPLAAPHKSAWDKRLWATIEVTKAVQLKIKGTSEDEYQHQPNIVLVKWDEEAKTIGAALLLSDFEADRLLPEIRRTCETHSPKIPISLHHTITRMASGQPEALLTHLSLPSRVVDEEWRREALGPLCAQISVFSSSLFYTPGDRKRVLRFLGLVPAPGRDLDSEITVEQWKTLKESGLLVPGGFVNQKGEGEMPGDQGPSEETLEVWKETARATPFQESPVELLRGIAELRNLSNRLKWSQVGSWTFTV